MIVFKMNVSGVDELQKKLEAIGKDISDVLEEATAAGAVVVARKAQENSRKGGVFPRRITGNLFRSIRPLTTKKSPGRVEVLVGSDNKYTKAPKRKKNSKARPIVVGSPMEYARRLEHGFMDTDKLGRRYNQQPRPFLRPALDDNTDEIEKAIAKKLEQVVRRYS
jgi:HK97 gp10 family phage protein